MKDLFFEASIGNVKDEKVDEIADAFRAFCDEWEIDYDEPSVYEAQDRMEVLGKTVVVYTADELDEASRRAKAGDTIVVGFGESKNSPKPQLDSDNEDLMFVDCVECGNMISVSANKKDKELDESGWVRKGEGWQCSHCYYGETNWEKF